MNILSPGGATPLCAVQDSYSSVFEEFTDKHREKGGDS